MFVLEGRRVILSALPLTPEIQTVGMGKMMYVVNHIYNSGFKISGTLLLNYIVMGMFSMDQSGGSLCVVRYASL